MAWEPKALNTLTGPDAAATRAIIEDLQQWLKQPTFEEGIYLGDGQRAYNSTEGISGQVTTALVTVDSTSGDLAPVREQVIQTVTASTDANGFITVNHNCTATPEIVLIEAQAPISGTPIAFTHLVDTIGATTFRVRFLTVTAGAVAAVVSTSVTFRVLSIV